MNKILWGPNRVTIICAALIIALVAFVAPSCTPPEIVEEKVEDPRDTLFDVLLSENNHSSDLNLRRVREFYSGALPRELPAKLSANQASAEISLTASLDRSVFDEEAEFADFVLKFLKDASVLIKSSWDPVTKDNMTNIDVVLSGQKLAGADILFDGGERLGVSLRELYPTYLTMDYQDLMIIISEAVNIDSIGQLSFDNLFALGGRYVDAINLALISDEQANTVLKPFIDKLKETLAMENVEIARDVPIPGAGGPDYKPDGTYTRVTVSLADDDLRRVLTALVRTAKENTALHALIREKYSAVYGLVMEMAEFGLINRNVSGLPPVEGIDGIMQSVLNALESMLGSPTGFPIKAMAMDLYLDGAVLKRTDIGAWTTLPEIENEPPPEAGGADSGVQAASGNPDNTAVPVGVDYAALIKKAGAPALQIILQSFDDADGWRNDAFYASYINEKREKNEISLSGKLAGGDDKGESILNAALNGPAFDGGITGLTFNYGSEGIKKSFMLRYGARDSSGAERPLTRFYADYAVDDAGDGYVFNAELDVNDPNAVSGVINAPDSAYAVGLRCGGRLAFGPVEIPPLQNENVYMLDQDSFYDGTFQAVFNEFRSNLIRFASANRQLLSLYGFPGF